MNPILDYLTRLPSTEGFPARWWCGQWTQFHGWLYILSDLAIWGAYFTIPVILLTFTTRRRDLPFPRIFWLFAAFICACGLTHLLDALMFWWPAYRLTGLVYLITGIISWATVIALIPVIPQAFALRSPKELEKEILERKQAEEKLRQLNEQLQAELLERKNLESQLIQIQKMESIGQLAAGVAHEINNPIGFVTSNLGTLSKYVAVFKQIIGHYQEFANPEPGKTRVDTSEARLSLLRSEIEAICPASELTYILEDVDGLLLESEDGTRRVQEIVQSLKSFSRVDEGGEREINLNECIEATLKIVWNELKYKCTVHKQLGDLPMIRCHPGHLNQVFMNLLVNAAQAIEERGEIVIETHQLNPEQIMVKISDTGHGIAPEALPRIFNPFFTTKPIGQGTGLGLSISYDIIQKHNGTIEVQSEAGKGTTFTIVLPIC